MQIKVLIPYYKAEKQLAACMKALDGQVAPGDIIVHDDSEASTGFVRASNELLRPLLRQDVDYAILLNQDCYLKPGAVGKMIDFMEKHPKCAIGGIKHFGPVDKDLITHGGCTQAFPNGLHLAGYQSKGELGKNKRMPWVNGACMIIRMDAIVDIGLMDPNYKLICSDSDWCYTARDRGWEVWYIADAECVHDHGLSKSTKDVKTNKIKLLDTVRFRDKWITDGVYRELFLEIF